MYFFVNKQKTSYEFRISDWCSDVFSSDLSPSASLDHAIASPAGLPEHASLRTDRPDAMPPQAVMARHMDFFADPKAKEMLVTPKGVRLVYQADRKSTRLNSSH